jgi:hypothetical protein
MKPVERNRPHKSGYMKLSLCIITGAVLALAVLFPSHTAPWPRGEKSSWTRRSETP